MTHIARLYPRLVVSDGAAAIDFYRTALGAKEVARHHDPDGKIVHAELTIGGVTVALKDEGYGDLAPTTLGGTPVIIALYVDDADAVGEAMTRAGATVLFPIADQPHGERGGRLADPFGHQWMVAQPLAG
jgi:uncharacterized glyoxalase superfamily protein PhnB